MAITVLDPSPNGEYNHIVVRNRINEVIEGYNSLTFAQKTHGNLVHTTADGTGIPNPSGVLSLNMTNNGGDVLLTPPVNPQPVSGGDYKGYVKITGMVGENISGAIQVSSGEFVIGAGGTGHYNTSHAYIDIAGDISGNNIGIIFAVERGGYYYFSQRPTGQRMQGRSLFFPDDTTNISGGGSLDLQEGDKVSVWICSEKDATLDIYAANLGLSMEYQTILP